MSKVSFIMENVSVWISDKYVGYIEVEDLKPYFIPQGQPIDFDALDQIKEKLSEMS